MKKLLLVLALVANVAMAEEEPATFIAKIKDLGSDVGGQLVEIVTVPVEVVKDTAVRIKDASVRVATNVKDASKKAAIKVKDFAQAVKDSEAGQDIADVAGPIVYFPVQFYEDATDTIKDGFNATVDGTKTLGKKIVDSKFATKVTTNVKAANQAIIDTTKKAVTKVKDVAHDVANSEAYGDVEEFFGQIGDGAKDTWNSFAALFKASKEKII
jgi:hypothetical protein